MTGSTTVNEHDNIVRLLCESNAKRYAKVLHNLDGEKNSVAGLFPDVIIQDANGTLLFIIEVKKNGNIAQCIQQWKSVPKIPAFLYIVVPEIDLANAKSIAQVVGLQAKFGYYKKDETTQKIEIKYE
jgi:hypothetical protein